MNDKPTSIDHLLEEALLPNHLWWEDGEDAACTPGSVLSELDVCLTPQQLSHFMPVDLPHDSVGSKSGWAGNSKQQRQRREVHQLIFSLWTGAVVPYVFNASFPHQDRILVLSAMAEWERMTCVRFRPATADDRDLIVFRDGKRCSTNIGRVGGEQLMTLAQPCRRKRILIHELGHVLGLIHEHQRQDRDHYVTVMLHNVRNSSQERYQFSKLAPSSLTDQQVPYSYASIMHYGKNYFAKVPELTTLVTADPKYQDVIGRAELPADSDAEAVNLLYGCAAPAQNRLPDSTCELFKRTGECDGLNKATIRPLCPRSCRLHYQQQQQHQHYQQQQHQQGYRSHSGYLAGLGASQVLGSAHHSKSHATVWGHSSNVIGQGVRVADPAASSTIYPSANPRAEPPVVKQSSVFGNPPQQRRLGSVPFSLGQQQIQDSQHHQSLPASLGLAKWFPSVFKNRSDPSSSGSGQVQQMSLENLPSWFRTRATRPNVTQRPKVTEPPRHKVERQMNVEAGGGADVSMAAHNMKALSPEALPEAIGRPPPSQGLDAGSGGGGHHQDSTHYSYDTPQHMGLLQSMLWDRTLPREAPQQGTHVTRPLHALGSFSAHGSQASAAQGTADHGPEMTLSSRRVQASSGHSYNSGPITNPPSLLTLLGPRDVWTDPLQQSRSSSQRATGFAAPSSHTPTAEGWYLGTEPSTGAGGGGGGGGDGWLVGGFEAFRNSQSSGPVVQPLGPSGPDSRISFFLK